MMGEGVAPRVLLIDTMRDQSERDWFILSKGVLNAQVAWMDLKIDVHACFIRLLAVLRSCLYHATLC